jgi:NAD(P)-dependent dehydrogenase (short-subunit alcohol dehydrogenase family)
MKVSDRVAVVTGGAMGTGRAIAVALAAAGAKVVVCDIDEIGGQQTVMMAAPGRCQFQTLDVTDPKQVTRVVNETRPQILVNNAGGGGHVPALPHPSPWRASPPARLT